jgi:putative oxidoreductase
MRMVAGAALMTQGITILWGGPQIEAFLLNLLATGAGLLLLAGLWTPIAGAMVAFLELWKALSQPVDPWTHILLGTVGAALAFIGPGAWSVDARLFGWKRIDIPTPKS